MIVVIFATHTDQKTGKKSPVVSHGVDTETLQDIVLPFIRAEDVHKIAKLDMEINEWVIN
jgi:hypothetical protein